MVAVEFDRHAFDGIVFEPGADGNDGSDRALDARVGAHPDRLRAIDQNAVMRFPGISGHAWKALGGQNARDGGWKAMEAGARFTTSSKGGAVTSPSLGQCGGDSSFDSSRKLPRGGVMPVANDGRHNRPGRPSPDHSYVMNLQPSGFPVMTYSFVICL